MNTLRISRATLGLCAILVGYLLQTTLYAFFTPAWESPDEPSHYLYVAYLARYARPPNPSSVSQSGQFYEGGYVTSMYEWYHPALGYAWQALAYRALQIFDATRLPDQFPDINPLLARQPFEHPRLFLPMRVTPFDLPRADVGIFLLRLASALLGVPLIWAVYRAARVLLPDQDTFALTVAGLAAFIPQFDFISATIRNDTANNLFSAMCVLVLLKLLTAPANHPTRRALGAGALLGLTLLTKATAAFLLPAALLAFLLAPYTRGQRARMIGAASGAFAVIVGGYLLRFAEARRALEYSLAQAEIKPGALTLDYFLSIPSPLRDMFWARFGWANVLVPDTWIAVATTLGLIGIALTVARWVSGWRRNGIGSTQDRQLFFLFAVVALNAAMVFRYNLYAYQPQGRFLFPSLAALSILALWGAWQLLTPRGKWIIGIAAIGLMLAFNLGALFGALIPAYY